MAKIQRLALSTDQKMAMLRGQPGHMPTPAVAGEEAPATPAAPEAAEAETTAPTETPKISPVAATEAPAAVQPPSVPVALPPAPQTSATAPPARRGPGRPRKADAPAAPAAIVAPTTGLPPSLIRLEGAAQFAALSYVREEMLRGRRVYLKQLVDEAILYYLQHGPPAQPR